MVHKLMTLTAAASPVDGSQFKTFRSKKDSGLIQVSITAGAGTILIQGRVSEAAPWADIISITASGLSYVVVAPFMRAKATPSSAMTAKVWLDE